jgi:gas vesicle protein
MAKREESSSFTWFMAGLTIGIAGAILFAPKSGRETRDSIGDAASRGREFAGRKKREAADFGRDIYRRGREFAEEEKDAGKSVLTELSLAKDDSAPSGG